MHELVEGLCFRNKARSLYQFEKLTQDGGLQVRVAHSQWVSVSMKPKL